MSTLILLAATALAQDPRGTILGRVTDPTEARIPNVEVRVTNVASGVSASTRTNDTGSFNIPFLLPGFYRVSAEAAGLKGYVREGVQVRVGDIVELNIQMEVGPVTERIDVKEETPLLSTASSSLGQVIDQQRVLELPVVGGNPIELMFLTAGVITNRRWMPMKAPFTGTAISADGNPAFTNEFQMDGVSNTFADGAGRARDAFRPPSTVIQEFKIQTSSYDASIGHTMGAFVSVNTASGTNRLHGEAHYWARNSAFDAPNFFNNKNNTKVPAYADHRFGASAGGPVRIPGLYNGRDKTFWHYAWEANKWGDPRPFTGTVPTAAERRGDFSELLSLGSRYQIYDPATTTPASGGRFGRQPLPNNIIPSSRLDPVGVNLAKFYPLPSGPGTADGQNNFFSSTIDVEDYYVHFARVDHAFSESHRMFVRANYDHWLEDKQKVFGYGIQGIIMNRINRGLAVDHVLVLSPALVLNLRYGLTNQEFPERRVSRGFDLASLGFSPALVNLVDKKLATIPRVSASPFSTFSNWEEGDGTNTGLTHSFAAAVTHLRARHNLKYGADLRVYRAFGNRFPRSVSPDLIFSATYTRGPLDNSPVAPVGQELASMLLGIPGGSMEASASYALQDRYHGLYLHDDFKITDRLTLNLGLRYELESPITERYNRLVAGFAFGQANPIEAQARANYTRNPIPELPPNQFRVLGGQLYLNQEGAGRAPFRGEKNNFLPRFGFAYQLNSKTTLRGGYGVFYDSIGVNATRAIQTGFSQSTPIQASLDSGLTFVATLANPFPNGLLSPPGAAGGLMTNLGQSIAFYPSNRKHAYSQRWSFGFQRLMPGRFVVDASYVGNRGTRLGVDRSLNDTPAQYLSTSRDRDEKTINFLSAQSPNPFYGIGPIYGANISRAALLRPFPHFGGLTQYREPIGYSWYHSLQVQAEKRLSQGYTFQLTYTWSKLMEATQFLNATDARPSEVVGDFDRTHRVAMSGIWELPVGRGKQFGAKLPTPVNFVIGGWQISGIVVRQSGPPLGFGNAIFNGNLKDIPLPSDKRSVDRWLNVDAGFNRDSRQQLEWNIRAFPLRFGGIRTDSVSRWDLAAVKSFPIGEKLTFQFRAEVYNALNHPSFSGPNTSPTSSAFGRVTGTMTDARSWQLAGKLKF
ncbi:MAG: TonB-dependent receptor [Acidobacteriota bacterium]